ncbi:hypothetical protein HYV70_04720 [Candidatus Uhrbacteria bacterium]|nr:hypothetical protein [Candidatus Uhrbacteria bacterium]
MLIPQLMEQQRFDLYENIFRDEDIDLSPEKDFKPNIILELIDTFPKNEQEKIRKEFFKRVKQDLQDENVLARLFAVSQIKIVLEMDRLGLIEQALQDKNIAIRCEVIGLFTSLVSKEDKQRLFEQALKDKEMKVRKRAAEQFCVDIWKVPKKDRPELIEQARHMKNPDLSDALEKHLSYGLLNTDFEDRTDNHTVIPETPLKDSDQTQRAQNLIRDIKQTGSELFQHWKALAKTTPLYKDVQDPFFVESFSKTGSGTTLLDQGFVEGHESLRNRAIIRHIDLGPFQGWKRAYEDVEFWKNQGFDYVPVEPIVKATLNPQTYRVDVVTRVLPAPSVAIWKQDVGFYTQTIDEQVEKIKKALETLGVAHGHTHENNFIVYFDRDEQDEPILEKPPKVYVIDFDRAVSSQNN